MFMNRLASSAAVTKGQRLKRRLRGWQNSAEAKQRRTGRLHVAGNEGHAEGLSSKVPYCVGRKVFQLKVGKRFNLDGRNCFQRKGTLFVVDERRRKRLLPTLFLRERRNAFPAKQNTQGSHRQSAQQTPPPPSASWDFEEANSRAFARATHFEEEKSLDPPAPGTLRRRHLVRRICVRCTRSCKAAKLLDATQRLALERLAGTLTDRPKRVAKTDEEIALPSPPRRGAGRRRERDGIEDTRSEPSLRQEFSPPLEKPRCARDVQCPPRSNGRRNATEISLAPETAASREASFPQCFKHTQTRLHFETRQKKRSTRGAATCSPENRPAAAPPRRAS